MSAVKRLALTGVALVVAVTPAVVGLVGNASFSGAVPVRVPAGAQTAATSTAHDAGDDHGGDRTPSPSRTTPGDDHPSPTSTRHAEAGDDHGGDRPAGTSDDGATTTPRSTSTVDDHGGLARSGSSPGSGSSGSSGSGGSTSGSGSSGSGSSGSSGSGRHIGDAPAPAGGTAVDDHGGRGGDDGSGHR